MTRFALDDEAPLYVRWEPAGLTFAIELRLDLMGRIERELEAARDSGVEVGGVFLGRPPLAATPILRIDEIMPISRRPEDGPIFMLDPREHDRFLTTRWDAKSQGRSAVGFFRTHVRPGALRLSLADRTLVTGHFTKEAMVVMLVETRTPYRAALFAGVGTRLPAEPSIPEFVLDQRAFEALPELNASRPRPKTKSMPASFFWAFCLVVVLAATGAAYRMWNELATAIPGTEGRGPGLRVTGGPMLTVDWDHYSGDVRNSSSAKLEFADGSIRRELTLGPDALRLGAIEYEPRTPAVSVTLTLVRPDASSVVQSVSWHGSPAK